MLSAEPKADVLTKVDTGTAVNTDGNRVRASWWRYFQACLNLLERGIPPTLVAIAKELRVSRQTVWALQKRHPALLEWINSEFVGRNKNYFGPVQYRCAQLAMQGSAEHANLYLRSLSMGFAGEGAPLGGVLTVVQNYLVPRPEIPQLEASMRLPPPLQVPTDIPTLKLR